MIKGVFKNYINNGRRSAIIQPIGVCKDSDNNRHVPSTGPRYRGRLVAIQM